MGATVARESHWGRLLRSLHLSSTQSNRSRWRDRTGWSTHAARPTDDLKKTVSDAELANLRWLTNLSYLDLDGTRVSDAVMAHLEGLTKLSYLNLRGTQVSDAGLAQSEEADHTLRPRSSRHASCRRGAPRT